MTSSWFFLSTLRKFDPVLAINAYGGSGVIVMLFLNLGTWLEVAGQLYFSAALSPRKEDDWAVIRCGFLGVNSIFGREKMP